MSGRTFSRQLVAAATLLLCSATIAHAQTVVETPTVRLELIGLKRWTVPMIQDSLAVYAPKDSITSHACAAILRGALKFADASAVYYSEGYAGLSKEYVAVTVVEPQDSSHVRYKAVPPDSLPRRREWKQAIALFERKHQAFQAAIQDPVILLGNVHRRVKSSAAQASSLRTFLRAHNTPRDRRLALWTLEHDATLLNRAIAVVLLANFRASDSTWWALADELRDPQGMVSGTATQVLSTLVQSAPRRVDWAPAADGLRAVLDGTNLFAHDALLDALAATQVDPGLAPQLLHGGGELVVAKLRAQSLIVRLPAHRFLVQISGHDFGEDAAAWVRWISGV